MISGFKLANALAVEMTPLITTNASLLPETPFNADDIIKTSAYLPVLISAQLYNLADNIMGVGPKNRDQIRYGVADFELFKYRMNLFIANKPNVNYLNNLDWSSIAVSGSIMACCLPNFNPLMLNFMTKLEIINKSEKFINYVNEYYRDADIDMLSNLDGHAFIDKAYLVANTIETNIKASLTLEQLENNKDLFVTVKPVKSVAVIINADFIKKYLVTPTLSFGDIVTDINNIKVKQAVYPLYLKHKHNKNLEFSENPDNNHIWTNNIYAPEFDIVSVEQLQVIFAKTKKDKQDEANERAKQIINFDNDLQEILQEYNAGLVSINGDNAQLLNNALYLINNPDVRKKMGTDGRLLLENLFSVSNAAKQILSHF